MKNHCHSCRTVRNNIYGIIVNITVKLIVLGIVMFAAYEQFVR